MSEGQGALTSAQTIFADNSYSKPYLVTYLNTATFSLFLLSLPINGLARGIRSSDRKPRRRRSSDNRPGSSPSSRETDAFLKPNDEPRSHGFAGNDDPGVPTGGRLGNELRPARQLNLQETARLSLEFCILWFGANYLVAAGLEYTSVASSTILASTSSMWTLLFGAALRVEKFTFKKLLGVIASLVGVFMISSSDASGESDRNRGSFPFKSPAETAIGDLLSIGSAVLYGFYTIFMKKRIGDPENVNMFIFLGFVGVFNVALLWPGFFILHFSGIEKFHLPPTSRIWTIIVARIPHVTEDIPLLTLLSR